ncbi:MAG: pyridoxamine 5'-phosphate oxidase family protein [Dehalococcoidales bacterium]|nr:pyridoxamine 5'-phosphate oxidase family protein [Dehalococcoidales bacterium]
MAKLSEEIKTAIGTIRPSLVATASKTGKPNVSAKGSLRILDDEHVLFADVASPRTVKNIKENPQVAIICLDAKERKGCRIWGKGEVLSSGEIFDKVAAELAARNMKLNNVVKVTVEEAEII